MTDTTAPTPPPAPTSPAELSARLAEEVARIDRELGEVDLLVTQAKVEASRHETRRSAASDKLSALTKGAQTDEVTELSVQLVTLTKRAALMESQVEVLEGKRGAMARHRETMAAFAEMAAGVDPASETTSPVPRGTGAGSPSDGDAAVPRLLLSAQEDLRRELARAMHDGPAQSLTNIVLQAQIAERLVGKDPAQAQAQVEIRQLVAMVQQTLEATKTFIFDVRPMVLDDLGLVPTLRRSSRERGKRAGVTVDFETLGQDRRLPMEIESGLFRILDEALVAYLERAPDHVSLSLDWGEILEATVRATRDPKNVPPPAEVEEPSGADLPPALAAMVEERRKAARDAIERARKQAMVNLPATAWREIQGRAAPIGISVELLDEGSVLHIVAPLPAAADG